METKDLLKKDEMLSGLVGLERIPDMLFIPALQHEKTTVAEAVRMDVSIVGVCDTNANPLQATYVIPANDDAVKSITMIVNLVAEAVKDGRMEFDKKNAMMATTAVTANVSVTTAQALQPTVEM